MGETTHVEDLVEPPDAAIEEAALVQERSPLVPESAQPASETPVVVPSTEPAPPALIPIEEASADEAPPIVPESAPLANETSAVVPTTESASSTITPLEPAPAEAAPPVVPATETPTVVPGQEPLAPPVVVPLEPAASADGEALSAPFGEEAFDVAKVVALAEAAMRSSGDAAAGRAVLDGSLLEWEDVARESPVQGLEAKVVELYVAYAHLERNLRQFKQAAKVYDTASESAVASSSAEFWLDYAGFAVDRKKYETAKELYIKALRLLPEDEALWEGFASLARDHLGEPAASTTSVRRWVFPDEEQPPASLEEPSAKKPRLTDDGRLPLLFGDEARSADVDAARLDAQQTADFVKLAREPTVVEVVEGCRVIAALQTAEIEETWAAVRVDQAKRLRAAADAKARRQALATFHLEDAELSRTASVELKRLNHGLQSILKLAGLPLLAKSDDPDLVHRQSVVVHALLAHGRSASSG